MGTISLRPTLAATVAEPHNKLVRRLMATVADIRKAPPVIGAEKARRERLRWAAVILDHVAQGIRTMRPAVELAEDPNQQRIDFGTGWKPPVGRPADVLPVVVDAAIEAHLCGEYRECSDLEAVGEVDAVAVDPFPDVPAFVDRKSAAAGELCEVTADEIAADPSAAILGRG